MVDEPWELLWDQAMIALDSLRGYARIDWAFGGGTAMRLFFDHRESKDIDIFPIRSEQSFCENGRALDDSDTMLGRFRV